MFHGPLDTETENGLKELRKRIEAAQIPSSCLDESIILATWNIREFGRRPRSPAAIHFVAEILGQFDLIAVTELRDNLTDLSAVMKILGPYWNIVFSDFDTDARGNRERIGYLYDKRAVVFTGLAAEPNPPRKKDPEHPSESVPDITWWRSPYMASFCAGNYDFILLTAHIRWGNKQAQRIRELKMLADWVDARSRQANVYDKDWIVLGDFNIPSTGSELFEAITSKGLRLPQAFLDVGDDRLAANLAKNKRYDQILHSSRRKLSTTGAAGVLDFYAGDFRPLFPESTYPYMTKNKFTYEMSDHLPLWLEIDLTFGESRREQRFNLMIG